MGIETLAIAAVTAISQASGVALSFAAFQTAIAFTTVAITATVAIGLSYAQQALARTQTDRAGVALGDSPAAVNSPEVRGNVKQATPPQRIVFGEARFGGSMFLYEVRPPYLYVGFIYSSLPITEFSRLFVGETEVRFSSLPDNTIVSPIDIDGQADFPSRLSVCVQRGSLGQGVNAMVSTHLSEFGERFMMPGIPNAVFRCHFGADQEEFIALWGNVQIPNFQWVAKGTPLPDPRVAGTRFSVNASDPEDLHHALSTWTYSENAALVEAFWAAMPFGLRAGLQSIDWVDVVESADFDDEMVALKDGGYQRRHTISGIASLADKPNVVMEAMLTANRGFTRQRAGTFSVVSSQPRDPIFTITDEMLIGGFDFRNMKPKRDLMNVARCKFVAPDREYQDADGPVLRRDDLIDLDGEEFEQSARLPFTTTHQRAQRLMKGFMLEARLGRFLTLRCDTRAYGLREGDIIRRSSETGRYSSHDGLYSIEEWALSEDKSTVTFSLAEYNPTIARDWIPSADELPFELEAAA